MVKKVVKRKKKTKAQLERIERNKKFKAWSIEVRNNDGNKCVKCGAVDRLNAHHVIPRQNHEFRFDVKNGISLCPRHHRFSFDFSAHHTPFQFMQWFMENRRWQYDYLKTKLKQLEVKE